MAFAPNAEDGTTMFDRFLQDRGHDLAQDWELDYQKKQCPECRGLHDLAATSCSVCGWSPIV